MTRNASTRPYHQRFGPHLLLLLMLLGLAPVLAARPLVLGVHPYLDPNELARRFQPLANYLADRLGQPVTLRIGESYEKHIDAVGRGAVDIGFLGPASYVSLVRRYGGQHLLARLEVGGEPTFHGRIVTRHDSGLQQLSDLAGKTFAFGSPASTMGHLVPRYLLLRAGIGLENLAGYRFYGSHEDVAMAVLAGDADAGAVKEEIAAKFRSRGLTTLATTPALSEHLFVARGGLPAGLVARIRDALLALDRQHPETAAVLSAIKPGATALVPVDDADYAELRGILAALDTTPATR